MASGLAALLDDVAALAKMAARASSKAAGVVIDDAAVTPGYVRGLAAQRELPIIRKIATGSLRNKVLFILPAALILSEVASVLVEVLLIVGGTYLCFEGAEKVHHLVSRSHHGPDVPAAALGPEAEAKTVSGAIRTDFILSAEIMVIALKEVLDLGLVSRALILLVVAVLITAVVYGAVALIVKMDDIGLRLAERPSSERTGRMLVDGMPKVLAALSTIGMAAMLWVGGHILLVGADELGWHWPYGIVHDVEHAVDGVPGVGGVLAWLVNTAISAAVGLATGIVVVAVVTAVRAAVGRGSADAATHR